MLNLQTYLFNAAYPPYLPSISIHPLMTNTLFYDYKFAESLGFVTPLSLIFEDIGTKEVIIIIIQWNK